MLQDILLSVSDQALPRVGGLLLVLDTPKGRGIFASQRIAKGTVVEVSPVLMFTGDEVEHHTSKTCLQHYTYYWPSSDGKSSTQVLALGLGSMFNHSRNRQNVTWSRDVKSQCIIYTAYRDIEQGEELCISYGNGRLWFKDTDGRDQDDYSKIAVRHQNGETGAEIEISGLGAIDL